MARSREAIWLGLVGGFVAVGGVLLGISAAFGAVTRGYSTWTSATAIVAYVLFGLSAAALACAIVDVPIPLRTGPRNARPAAGNARPAAAGVPAEKSLAPGSGSIPVAEPAPARLEVVRQTGGRLEAQNAIERLTLFNLSRELWGQPEGGPFDFLRNRRQLADRLAGSNREVRDHLDAALRMVPDHSRISDRPALCERSAVGILTATVELLVKVRNLGSESGGVTLTSSAGRVVHPPVLQLLDAWVEYSVTTDETRRVVAPGTPVDIPVTVRMGCARTLPSKIPLDTSHAIAIARVSRAFAGFLSGPVQGIEVDALLDGGEQVRAALEISIRAAAEQCALRELDVDELERHASALDEAIDRQREREHGR